MAKSDLFERVNQAALGRFESLLREWLPGGTKSGAEYSALNPTRADTKKGSFSVNVLSGIWSDFATGDRGSDPVSLFAYLFHNDDQGAAVKDLASVLGVDIESKQAAPPTVEKPRAGPKTDWMAIPPPLNPPLPPAAHIKRGNPEQRWEYRGLDGRILGYICRFVTSDGGKEVLPLAWCQNLQTGDQQWRWMAFPVPRWLFGLNRLSAHPEASVLLVEGEKCAEAAQKELPELVCMTWPGGSKAVDKCDFTPLAGRKVILWPDADAQTDKAGQLLPEAKQPGLAAMVKIAAKLQALDCRVWLVTLPPPGEKPGGWDVADAIAEGLTGPALAQYVRERCRVFAPPEQRGSVPPDAPIYPERQAWENGLIYRRSGELEDCLHNVFLILSRHPDWSGVIGFNEFTYRVEKIKPTPFGSDAGEWTNTNDYETSVWLAQKCQILIKSDNSMVSGVMMTAMSNKFNPVRDWFDALPRWDGVNRLNYFLSDCLGCNNSEYLQNVGRYFLIGMVARVYKPGCTMQYMPVLEGKQGIGKSAFWRVLGGEWYQETPFNLGDKDAYMLISGALLYEIAELDSFNKAETTAMKAFITRQSDRYREPYSRRPMDRPRQCVFAGTTNHNEYLKDTTGNRRIWPIKAVDIDLEQLAAIREQLFAEATTRFRAGERWYPTREEENRLFSSEQEARQIVDPWLYPLQEWLDDPMQRPQDEFTSAEILCGAFKVELAKIDGNRGMAIRVGNLMAELEGWKRERRSKGRREWVYVRPMNQRISK
jgi:putative DNA primase/helicase